MSNKLEKLQKNDKVTVMLFIYLMCCCLSSRVRNKKPLKTFTK